MVEHGLAWVRHAERQREIASIVRERELKRAMGTSSPADRPTMAIRFRIGHGLMRLGNRIATGEGS